VSFTENTSKLSPRKSAANTFHSFFGGAQTETTIERAPLFTPALRTKCGLRKSFAENTAKPSPTKFPSCVIVDAGKAPMKSLGTTHHELSRSMEMSCRLAQTHRPCDMNPLRFRDSCRSTSLGLNRNVHKRALPSEKFRRAPHPPAISPAAKPPPTSAAVSDSSMAWVFPSFLRAAARSTTGLISMPICSRISAEGGPGRRLYGP
jgi:hypothetical protein